MPSGQTSIYMCFGDVRGDVQVPGQISKAPASGGWMTLLSVEFAAHVNYGQRTAAFKEGSDATPLRVTKETDSSSTGMLRNALLGAHDKGVAIVFLRTSDGEAPQEYMRLELVNAGITDFSIEGGADERSTESYAITFAEITVITWIHDGSARGSQAVAIIQNRP
ncbi:type VI secretion system tube protein Hcp [Roseomonas sp. PWR1]|uniref:Type VI secretion system tube protein Hcp n=1 Tax=Roseomonas nitratireducens TaxID=2820810 RepID=A0ABS4AZF6_9PROT|nr:type VI secretion system tube protein Hcp [Neoroseomonas nitratireducens]MBP0466765.1 type VI secretion system tube protein Hcp [Neoroseomonas nitratireducens]